MSPMRCGICQEDISTLNAVQVDEQHSRTTTPHKFVAYCCPKCRAVLGTGPNGVDLRNDIVDKVIAVLRREQ